MESTSKEGFNQWTVPWEAPAGEELDALRAGTFRPPEFPVPPDRVEEYQRDGVVRLEGAFTDWVDRLRAGLARNLSDPAAFRFPAESTRAGEPGRFFDSYCNWTLIPQYWSFVFHSGAASLAGQMMKASAAQFYHEHVFMKEPGTQRATPWHQDIPYYGVSGDQTVSVYIALDDVDEEVAVSYVRGSHRWGKIYYPKVWLDGEDFNADTADESYHDTVPDIAGEPAGYDVVQWPLSAGDAVLFNFKTLHGTTDAPMRRGRSAFSTRWMGDDVRFLDRPGETSPPFEDTGMRTGDRMREDWFPVVWRRHTR